MSKPNATVRGHNFERSTVRELKALGFLSVVSSRSESKNMDDRGIDIFDMGLNGGIEFPYYIQNKFMTNPPNYHRLITGKRLLLNKPLLVFFRQAEKVKTRFMQRGDYVIMKKQVFEDIPDRTDEWIELFVPLKGNQIQPNIHKCFTCEENDELQRLIISYKTKEDEEYVAIRKQDFYNLIKQD